MLWGLGGKDTLTGGAGADTFKYGSYTESRVGASTHDTITDFSHAQGDKIDLSLIDASVSAAGNQAFAFVGTGAFTGVAGQLHYWFQGATTIVSGDTNGDKVADFEIALNGHINLAASDFVL